MKKLALVSLLLLAPAAVYLAAKTRAAEPDPQKPAGQPSKEEFETWAKELEARGIEVSAGLWDLQNGRLLQGWKEGQLLIPASTTKAVTTYAMLRTWKPDYTIDTEILGDLQGDTVKGDLVVKGAGDPFFTNEQVWETAETLKKLGVKRITGGIRADQSAYDGQRYGSGWEDTTADVLPPIAPMSVNFNRDDKGRLVGDPTKLAEEVFERILVQDGIAVEHKPGAGAAPARIAVHTSPPIRMLVQDINKFSNNFMVEMLVKRFGNGSWNGGVRRVMDFYKTNFGLGPESMKLTDASGLSKENRLSAKTLAIVLRSAWNDFEVGPEYISSLKVQGGEPFRLKHKDANLARRLRVKSGYLSNARSLTGYLQMPDGKLRVFAVILNGDSKDEDLWAQITRWAN
ncbi:MAG TPA: D-alanyl-D-alanine carboxypeptidase [Holophagaceae bacterium]|nr:D-alanyl-D-alanine carboxypeptidase [Holophagaceae bacterium]